MSDTALFNDKRVQIATSVTSPPATPTAVGDGVDIQDIRAAAGYQPRYWNFDLEYASGAGTVNLTGPVSVWGLRADALPWRKIAELNGGSTIDVATGWGYSEVLQFVGAYKDLLLIPAGVVGGGFHAYVNAVETMQA